MHRTNIYSTLDSPVFNENKSMNKTIYQIVVTNHQELICESEKATTL